VHRPRHGYGDDHRTRLDQNLKSTLLYRIFVVNNNQANLVYIALGTNLGQRLENLQNAAAALSPAVVILMRSHVYETPPWGFLDQPHFLNQVVQVETNLQPIDLLGYLKSLERQMGREKSIKYGPRLIDLDILFYNDLILDTPRLTIPHPRIAERGFVLIPLADLDPNLRHPISGFTVGEMLDNIDSTDIRLYDR
jgi:2-amino-4-hydroxy-6-hydroxymethyldihydropteridine diphosphokinase